MILTQPNSILKQAVPIITEWFRLNGRHFAWRDCPTPYHVWISEIMLQQTRIEAVIPYYDRFIKALPDIKSLSEADDEYLLKLWQGLGYYSRARNLKKCASLLMKDYGGKLPDNVEELEKLPGIGSYTAGAIASIAMSRPAPAVDGNVLRVVMRLTGQYDDVTENTTKKRVTEALKQIYLTHANAPSLLTQGLMELGEVICIPNGTPDCNHCPVGHLCVAHKENLTDVLPVRTLKTKRKIEQRTVFLLKSDNEYALNKRASHGLLADLWEFPNIKGKTDKQEVLSLFPDALHIELLGDTKHIFTHIEWQMRCYRVVLPALPPCYSAATKEEIAESYAIPGAFAFCLKKIYENN